MAPLRLVLDTNILISAALNPNGLQRKILVIAISQAAILYVSRPILTEYAGVLARPHLKIRRGVQLQIMQLIKNHSRLISPSRKIDAALDPSDNQFLECIDAARADFLVTGNLKHFPAKWKRTRILNSREFLDMVAPELLQ